MCPDDATQRLIFESHAPYLTQSPQAVGWTWAELLPSLMGAMAPSMVHYFWPSTDPTTGLKKAPGRFNVSRSRHLGCCSLFRSFTVFVQNAHIPPASVRETEIASSTGHIQCTLTPNLHSMVILTATYKCIRRHM